MKRFAIFLPGICILFFLAGSASAKTWTVGFLTGAEKGIQSGFVQMASQGLYKAKQAFGFNVITEIPEDVSQEAMVVALQKLLDRKPDLIMTTGFQMAVHVEKFAPRYPDIRFLVNDVSIENMPNVMSIRYAQHEGSFLAGVLAGRMTKTGRVGVVGGVDIPPVTAFVVGYKEGVRYANPKVQIQETYITKMPDFSGFSDPQKGAELAAEWYEEGVDIIFAVAGTTGNGIIQQAKKEKKYVIGVDIDQDAMAKGYVLTSMMKRLDNTTYSALSQIVQGHFRAGVTYYGLKDGGVSLTDMKFTKHLIPDEVLKELADIKQKIVSGEIQVTDSLQQE